MRKISADTQEKALFTHCIAVHKKRIESDYFIVTLNCPFSICAYLSKWRMQAFFDRKLSGHFGFNG